MDLEPDVAARKEYLERQLAQVEGFITRDKARLAASPGDFSCQLSLNSWEHEANELRRELEALGKP